MVEEKVKDFLGPVGEKIIGEAREKAKREKKKFKDALKELLIYYFGETVAELILR